jgi:hypothetical protein
MDLDVLLTFDGRVESDKATADFKRLDYDIVHNGFKRKEIAAVKTRYRTTYSRLLAQNEEVCRFEEEHQIETRWKPGSMEYNNALLLVSQRSYRRALDKLERLVVQRLLELTKLGMSGVSKFDVILR